MVMHATSGNARPERECTSLPHHPMSATARVLASISIPMATRLSQWEIASVLSASMARTASSNAALDSTSIWRMRASPTEAVLRALVTPQQVHATAMLVGVIVSLGSASVTKMCFSMDPHATNLNVVTREKQIGLSHLTSGAGPHASMGGFWSASKPIRLDQLMHFTTSTRQCVPNHAKETIRGKLQLRSMLVTTRIGGRSSTLLVESTAGGIISWLDCSDRTVTRCTAWKWQNAVRF